MAANNYLKVLHRRSSGDSSVIAILFFNDSNTLDEIRRAVTDAVTAKAAPSDRIVAWRRDRLAYLNPLVDGFVGETAH